MRKFLTSLAAISLIGGLFIFSPSRALAAAAGTAKVTSTDVDIIHVDVSRENDGNLQTYLAAPGAFINLQIRLDEAGDDADLVDTVAFSLKNAIFTGAYTNDNAYTCTDTGVDDNLDAGNLVWTTGNKAATPVATISASINCGAGTGADGGVDSAFSLEPVELQSLVSEAERAWRALGEVRYGPTSNEKPSLQYRRSLYVVSDVKSGDPVTENTVRAIRPGLGLPTKQDRKSTRLNSSHVSESRMPSSA